MSAPTLGIDGCRGGWLVASLNAGMVSVAPFPNIVAVADAYPDAALALIDMPIGLPDESPRLCDTLARQALGPRRASVFPVPCREAVHAASYIEACAANRRSLGRALSRQTWNICPRIAELDHYLRAGGTLPLREAHPELAFAVFAGAPLGESKHSQGGRAARLSLIAARLPQASALLERMLSRYRGQLSADDVLDALVLMLAGADGPAGLSTLPATVERDAAGLPRVIHLPHSSSVSKGQIAAAAV